MGKLLGEFPLEPEEHPEPDLVLCTHWHDDHICPESIPRLASYFPNLRFVVPNRSVDMLTGWGIEQSRIIPMMGSDSTCVDGINIHAIPAAHEELDINEDGAWYLGYVVDLKVRLYCIWVTVGPILGGMMPFKRHLITMIWSLHASMETTIYVTMKPWIWPWHCLPN